RRTPVKSLFATRTSASLASAVPGGVAAGANADAWLPSSRSASRPLPLPVLSQPLSILPAPSAFGTAPAAGDAVIVSRSTMCAFVKPTGLNEPPDIGLNHHDQIKVGPPCPGRSSLS